MMDAESMRKIINSAIANLNPTQIEIIALGIKQSGGIGRYGSSFIATAILEELSLKPVQNGGQ